MGLNVKLITADEAYHDNDGSLYKETGVSLITPPSDDTKLPENVDPQTLSVTCDDMCDTSMVRLGCTDEGHEYKCNAASGECPRSTVCSQFRIIPFDDGIFQRIVIDDEQANKAINIRKNVERPFNLLKHREGLEQVRVRSHRALIAKCSITTMATLLIQMESKCNDPEADELQLQFFDMAG